MHPIFAPAFSPFSDPRFENATRVGLQAVNVPAQMLRWYNEFYREGSSGSHRAARRAVVSGKAVKAEIMHIDEFLYAKVMVGAS